MALSTMLCAGGCYRTSEATVNGTSVSRDEFFAALKAVAGPKVLQQLLIQKLTLDEAGKLGIKVDEAELKPYLEQIEKGLADPEMRKFVADEIRARMLLKKILLREVSEERLLHLYDLFRDDLRRVEVYSLRCGTEAEARIVEESLKKGHAFHLLATTHGKYQADQQNGGFRGALTPSQILSRWGRVVGGHILSTSAQAAVPTFFHDGDWHLFFVGNVKESFEELRPALEEMVVAAERPKVMYRLLTTATITSPYLVQPSRLPNMTLFENDPYPWDRGFQQGPLSAPRTAPSTQSSPSPSTTPIHEDLLVQ